VAKGIQLDVAEMQRPSASFDFIHRQLDEWR